MINCDHSQGHHAAYKALDATFCFWPLTWANQEGCLDAREECTWSPNLKSVSMSRCTMSARWRLSPVSLPCQPAPGCSTAWKSISIFLFSIFLFLQRPGSLFLRKSFWGSTLSLNTTGLSILSFFFFLWAPPKQCLGCLRATPSYSCSPTPRVQCRRCSAYQAL